MPPTPTSVKNGTQSGAPETEGIFDINSMTPPVWNYTERDPLATLVACADFAARKHRDQRRKDQDQTPYINHPIGVANILTAEGKIYDPILVQVAILHDTIEDTDTTFEEIVENFGPEVAGMVAELSDDKDQGKQARKQAQIDRAPKKSRGAKIVGMCDKIYNLRDLTRQAPLGWDEARIREYFVWAEKVVRNYYAENEQLASILRGIIESHKESIK